MIDRIARRLGYAKVENRNLTTSTLRYLLDSAEGLVSGVSAAEEIAAGLVGRSFAAATVDGPLSPDHMMQIGRDLILNGESLWILPDLDWQQSYEIEGSAYVFDDVVTDAGNVLHVRYAWDRITGRGQSPLAGSPGLREMVRQAQHGLELETRAETGYLMPTPVDAEGAADLKADLRQLQGKVAPIEAAEGGYGDPQSRADYQPIRVGANPSATALSMFDKAQNLALVALGIPTELAFERSDGTATREAYRRFLHTLLIPLARLTEAAGARAGMNFTISFDSLAAMDLATKARAFKSIAETTGDIEYAANVSGLLAIEA